MRATRRNPASYWMDYDKDGNIVGVEILNASKKIENPRSLDYAIGA